MVVHANGEGTAYGPSTKRGLVGLLLQAGAVLAVAALLAGLLEAAIPIGTVSVKEGENAFAASVLRAVRNGTLAAAACVVQFAVLLLCFRGIRLCRHLLRNRRSGPRPV